MQKGKRLFLSMVVIGVFGGGLSVFPEVQEQNAQASNIDEEAPLTNEEKIFQIENRLISFEDNLNTLLVAKKNPQDSTESSLSTGRELFMNSCTNCHGSDGRGRGPFARAIPNIPDLASSEVQNKSDRELFNIITNGRPPMPSYDSVSKENRWNLVNFIRTFAPKNNE